MFKQASRKKLRIVTVKGNLSVEQLWNLSLPQLALIIKGLKKQLNKNSDSELSFLDENAKQVDPVIELSFGIVKDIYITKDTERKEALVKADKKADLQRLLEIKIKRVDAAKEEMSDVELEKEIARLSE